MTHPKTARQKGMVPIFVTLLLLPSSVAMIVRPSQGTQGRDGDALTLERARSVNLPVVEFNGTDVREALRWLFRQALVGGSIAPDVQGTVTMSLRDLSWETVLQYVTRQVDATYRIDHGFFEIVRREGDPPLPPREPWPSVEDRHAIEAGYRWLRYKVGTGRGEEVSERLAGVTIHDTAWNSRAKGSDAIRRLVKTERAYPSFSLLAFESAPTKERRLNVSWLGALVEYAAPGKPPVRFRDRWRREGAGPWRLVRRQDALLRFQDADLGDVLKAVFPAGVGFALDPRLSRRVSVDLTGLPFETAFRKLMDAADATYRVEGGVYRIVPRP